MHDKPLREDKLDMPEWERIILPGGSFVDSVKDNGRAGSNGIPDYIDLYNGVEAEFIHETISDGVATDSSALLIGANLEDDVLYNGAVRAEHDLGNAYVLATIGTDAHLRIYTGVERLSSDAGTFIEIEFNQQRVHIKAGAPWPIVGRRTDDDLLVRFVFANQKMQAVELEQWQQGQFNLIKTSPGIAGETCRQSRELLYCIGQPPIRHPEEGFEVVDENNNILLPSHADQFVEVGIDVDLLVGSLVGFAGVLIRTPEDIALNSFRVFEPLAQLEFSGFEMTRKVRFPGRQVH